MLKYNNTPLRTQMFSDFAAVVCYYARHIFSLIYSLRFSLCVAFSPTYKWVSAITCCTAISTLQYIAVHCKVLQCYSVTTYCNVLTTRTHVQRNTKCGQYQLLEYYRSRISWFVYCDFWISSQRCAHQMTCVLIVLMCHTISVHYSV